MDQKGSGTVLISRTESSKTANRDGSDDFQVGNRNRPEIYAITDYWERTKKESKLNKVVIDKEKYAGNLEKASKHAKLKNDMMDAHPYGVTGEVRNRSMLWYYDI